MKRNEGFGLIMAIFVLMFFSFLSMMVSSMFSTDVQISIDTIRSTQALFLAESAMNHCLKNQLYDPDDKDWSDNPDYNKSVEPGDFFVGYLDQDTNTANIRFKGRVGDVTRQITRFFYLKRWPQDPFNFPYSLYVGQNFDSFKNVSIDFGGSKTKEYVNSDPNFKMVDIDWDTDGFIKKTKTTLSKLEWDANYSNQTLEANFYVDGFVTIEDADNLTINGMIVAKGTVSFKNLHNLNIEGTILSENKILFDGCNNMTINPPSPYPGLLARKSITIVASPNLTINGGIFSEKEIEIEKSSNISFKGVLYSENHIYIDGDKFIPENNLVNLGTVISWDYTRIYYGGVIKIYWSDVILIQPLHMTWINLIGTNNKWTEILPRMRTWNETL